MVTTLYYKDVYGGGDVPEAAFPVWAMRAEERLCADTCGRSAEVLAAAEAAVGTGAAAKNTAPAALSGAVQHAVCAVAELLYAAHLRKTQGGALTGESVGSWRRSYAPASDEDCVKKIYAAEALYLGRTNLLYRGCARV
ncbi:MAG: hypothetical protein RR825_05310 [Ruthenibacterium sp.]